MRLYSHEEDNELHSFKREKIFFDKTVKVHKPKNSTPIFIIIYLITVIYQVVIDLRNYQINPINDYRDITIYEYDLKYLPF